MQAQVINNKIEITDYSKDTLISGGINYYELKLEFSEEWNGLTKKAIYMKDEEVQEIPILDNKTYIPQIEEGIYKFGVIGFTVENDIKSFQISTNMLSLIVEKGAGQYETTTEITPQEITLLEKYLEEFNAVITRIDEKIIEIEKKELDYEHVTEKIEESMNEFNENAIQKEQELNDIKDVAQSFVSAVTFSTFGVDRKMHLKIFTPKKLGNAGFKLERGRLKVKYGRR